MNAAAIRAISWLGLLVGCTVPVYEMDAQAGSLPQDFDPTGHYALVTRTFARDSAFGPLTRYVHKSIKLAQIRRDAQTGELSIELRLCSEGGKLWAPLSMVSVQTLYPERLPVRSLRLVVDAGSFHSEGPPSALGYQATPAACAPGLRISRSVDQSWIEGSECECPNSDALPPTLANDCRVVDVDGDGKPGLTLQLTGATESLDYVRVRDGSQLVDGVFAAEGHHSAAYLRNEDLHELQCSIATCRRLTPVACGMGVVRFAPVSPSWGCEQVLSEELQGRLFLEDSDEFPADC